MSKHSMPQKMMYGPPSVQDWNRITQARRAMVRQLALHRIHQTRPTSHAMDVSLYSAGPRVGG